MLGGGAGSILEMITRLRENRKLLSKRSYFKDGKSRFDSDRHIKLKRNLTVDHKKATPLLLKKIQQHAAHQTNSSRKKQLLVIGSSFIIVFGILFFFIFNNIRQANTNKFYEKEIRIQEFTKSEQELYNMYLYFIQDAENWKKKRKWHNAIFQYRKALEIYPNHLETQIKLANVLLFQCESEGTECFESYNFVQTLTNQYPDNPDVATLKERWNSSNKLQRNVSFSIN